MLTLDFVSTRTNRSVDYGHTQLQVEMRRSESRIGENEGAAESWRLQHGDKSTSFQRLFGQ